MMKTFEEFISERWGSAIDKNKVQTYADLVDDVYPGESVDVYFPEGFELECHLYRGGEAKLVKFNCAKLNVYYWDDDDHRCIDYYYYESEDDYKARYNDKWYSHICKDSDLTKESRAKVEEYLKNTPVPVRE